jgi:hypothetical protein
VTTETFRRRCRWLSRCSVSDRGVVWPASPSAVICLQILMPVRKTPHRSAAAQLLSLAKRRPVVRARDIADLGIHTGTLTRLTRTGALEKVGPGRYRLVRKQALTEHHELVVAATSVPHSVVCLISALHFHDIGTKLPPRSGSLRREVCEYPA